MAFEFIDQQLAQQNSQSRFRQRQCIVESKGTEITVDRKSYLNFSSNDYLGLNNHPLINKAMQEGMDRFGLCATGSPLITGHSYAHQALESTLCTWLNKPHCLLYNSGFAANSGVLQALGSQASAATPCNFWLDKLSHASLIDGAFSSKAKVKRFKHNDTVQLSQWLEKSHLKSTASNHANSANQSTHDNNLIISEGVFSMDGDQAPIAKLSQLSQQYNACLYIDDAHSIGIVGNQGQGSVSQGAVDIVMATFGKALATSGAFVACEKNVFEYLVNFSRHYIYSTAISPALAWATQQSILLAQQEQWRRDKVSELSHLLASQLNENITLLPTSSSIHALVIGDEKKSLRVSEKLKEQGIWLSAIRPPTVPKGTSRLRVTICASHNESDINYLAKKLNETLL